MHDATREQSPSPSDAALIDAYVMGERRALAEVDGWLLAVIRHRVWRFSAEHDDLLQECRLKLLRCLEEKRFAGRSSLKTFAQAIAKHTCLDTVRRATLRRTVSLASGEEEDGGGDGDRISTELLAAGGDQPDAGLERQQELQLCYEILAGLPGPCRRLFQLLLEEEQGYAEMATALGIAIGTVKSRLARCRDRAKSLRQSYLRRSNDR